MTIEQFDNTDFSGQTKVIHNDKAYELHSVDFEQKLLAFDLYGDVGDLKWVRCENVEIIKPTPPNTK